MRQSVDRVDSVMTKLSMSRSATHGLLLVQPLVAIGLPAFPGFFVSRARRASRSAPCDPSEIS